MQSWGISRFNGQLYALDAQIEHAGAALAEVSRAWKAIATPTAGQPAALVPARLIVGLRLCLCVTAVSALAAVPVAILLMLT